MKTKILDYIAQQQENALCEIIRMARYVPHKSPKESILYDFYQGKVGGYKFARSAIKATPGIVSSIEIIGGKIVTITELSNASLARIIFALKNVARINSECILGLASQTSRSLFLQGHAASINDILDYIEQLQCFSVAAHAMTCFECQNSLRG